MKRGVITSPSVISRDGESFTIQVGLTSETLNYYGLYWDRVVIPKNPIIGIGLPHEDRLIELSLIERPVAGSNQWKPSEDSGIDPVMESMFIVASEYLKDEHVDWTIHQFGTDFYVPLNLGVQQNAIKVELFNCLPVPAGDVDPEVILEYKEHRKDELEQLHQLLDEFYQAILSDLEGNIERTEVTTKLAQAILSLDKVSKEKFKKTKKYNFSVDLNVSGSELMAGIGTGGLLGLAYGIPIPIATAVGGLASLIKIKGGVSFAFEESKAKTKLGYLTNMHEHLEEGSESR